MIARRTAPGQGQPVPVRRRAARRRLPPARLGLPVRLARRRADARSRAARPTADEVVCPGVEGPNLAAAALAAYREAHAAGTARRCASRSPSACPSPPAWAAARATPPPRCGSPPRPPAARTTRCSTQIAPALGADVPVPAAPGRALVTGIGEHVEPLPPGPPAALVIYPCAHTRSAPRRSTREADRPRPPAPTSPRAERDRARPARCPTSTTSQDAAARRCARRSTAALEQLRTRGRRRACSWPAPGRPSSAASTTRSAPPPSPRCCPARSPWSRCDPPRRCSRVAVHVAPRPAHPPPPRARRRPRRLRRPRARSRGRAATSSRVLTEIGSLPGRALLVGLRRRARRRAPPRPRHRAWRFALGLLAIIFLVGVTKHWWDRPRPVGRFYDPQGHSFPSGHSAYAIVWLAAAIATGRRAFIICAAVVAVTIGASRLYLHVHYLTDVLGGFALGAAVFAPVLARRSMSNNALTYLIAAVVGVTSLALWSWLILVPAYTAYARWWQRVVAVRHEHLRPRRDGRGRRPDRRDLPLVLRPHRVSVPEPAAAAQHDLEALHAVTDAVAGGAGLPEVVRAAGRALDASAWSCSTTRAPCSPSPRARPPTSAR